MKKILASAFIFVLLLGSQDSTPIQAQGKQTSKLMAAKLQNSQKLLEGIATTDFKKISNSAEALIELTNREEWLMYKTPRYQLHSNEFRRAAETLLKKSKDKNIDGVTLAFFDMTMSCVRCHEYVREIRDARAPAIPLDDALLAVSRPRS